MLGAEMRGREMGILDLAERSAIDPEVPGPTTANSPRS
jgi:hypothetical protein